MKYPGILCLLACAICAPAQESIQSGSVGGQVTDPSGATVAEAKITVRQTETNMSFSALTDREGHFRLPNLRPGPYEIRVGRPGFADWVRQIRLGGGSAFELPVSLKLAADASTIEVKSEETLLEGARSQIAATVRESEIRDLPLSGRSFLELALLAPGVSQTNTGSTQLFTETSAVPGQGISIGSQRNFSNGFVVDGLSANDDAAGLAGAFYGLDTISELQVVTAGGQAEFGRAMAGYVSLVTKSGTNTLHGDLYGYFRNQRFNARNALSGNKLPMTEAQYGGSAGGPVRENRTFYFANVEHRALNQSGLVTISDANVAAINARLGAIGYQGPLISTGLYPNPVHADNVLAKIDHQISRRDQLTARYSLYRVHSENARGAGALNAVTAAAGLDSSDHTLAAGNVLTLTAHLVNETRGQYTHSDLRADPNDAAGPAVSIAGVATFGRAPGSPTRRKNGLVQIVNNLAYQSGAHAIRVGADFLNNNTEITFPRASRGSYSFSSLANFLAGTYNNSGFAQTFGNSTVSQSNPNAGVYVQDEWRAGRRLTLNLGIRYDVQLLRTIATDTNNLSPRFGFAWTPSASRRTVVRGGFGLFYDRVPLRALANALLSSGNTTVLKPDSQVSVSLSPAQSGAPVFPNLLASLPAGVAINFSTMERGMQNAYSEQGSVEVERQVGQTGLLTVGYEHLRGLHLILSMNQNVPACAAAGNNNGCRPNAAFANNSQYSARGDSEYNGLHLSFMQRPAKWANYRISYALSKATDDVGEFFFSSPIDNYNIWRDYGRSDDDQRHRLTANGAVEVLGFQLSGLLQYASALPFNIRTGTNTIQGTAARPVVNGEFIPRNAGSGFDLFTVNARVGRTFAAGDRLRVRAWIEAFNALNHVNGVTLNGTFGSGAYPGNPLPSFGQTTSAADGRTLQAALRLSF